MNKLQKAIVGQVKKTKISDKIFSKKIIIFALSFLIIVTGPFLLIDKLSKKDPYAHCKVAFNKSCAVNEISKISDATDTAKVNDLSEKIKNIDNYQQEPDLVIILVRDSINISDPVSAREYINKYKDLLASGKKISKTSSFTEADVIRMESEITFLEKQMKENPGVRYGG